MRVGPFGVPLDSDDEMDGGIELNRFNDFILGRNCADQQMIARDANCLMVA